MSHSRIGESVLKQRHLVLQTCLLGGHRAPELTIIGPDAPTANEPASWTFAAADPAAPDMAAGFTYRIDWDGDGTIDQLHKGGLSASVSHTCDCIDTSSPEKDVVNCGAGRDRVTASANDDLRGCEKVRTR